MPLSCLAYIHNIGIVKLDLSHGLFQVLSASVANALELQHDPQLVSTIEFLKKMDTAFDIMNVRYVSDIKPQRCAIWSGDDSRFQVCIT